MPSTAFSWPDTNLAGLLTQNSQYNRINRPLIPSLLPNRPEGAFRSRQFVNPKRKRERERERDRRIKFQVPFHQPTHSTRFRSNTSFYRWYQSNLWGGLSFRIGSIYKRQKTGIRYTIKSKCHDWHPESIQVPIKYRMQRLEHPNTPRKKEKHTKLLPKHQQFLINMQ